MSRLSFGRLLAAARRPAPALALLTILCALLQSFLPVAPAFANHCTADRPWHADYFNNQTLSGTPVYTACEAEINHDWGGNSPAPGVAADHFSVRWTIWQRFDVATDLIFIARADDGIRVSVDNDTITRQLVDAWRDQAPTEYRASRNLSAGGHAIRVEYYENGGGALAQFRWQAGPPADYSYLNQMKLPWRCGDTERRMLSDNWSNHWTADPPRARGFALDFTHRYGSAAVVDTALLAPIAGTLTKNTALDGTGYGYWALIDSGIGWQVLLAHMPEPSPAGPKVSVGDVVGRLGATGRVTGPHIHVEVRLYNRYHEPNPSMFTRIFGYPRDDFATIGNQFISTNRCTLPTAPVLSVGAITSTSVQLLWNDTNNEWKFQVAYTLAGTSNWQYKDLPADFFQRNTNGARAWTHASLSEGDSYQYAIRACNAYFCSNWSNIVTATTIPPNGYRVVLSWGAAPRDIDAHLWLPPAAPYQIYFNHRGSLVAFPWAVLDRDDIDSYGPETITIKTLQPGTYTYAVYNWSGERVLAGSNATVKVYRGNSTTPIKVYVVPLTGAGSWWDVFRLSSSGAITDINAIVGASPGPYSGAVSPDTKPEGESAKPVQPLPAPPADTPSPMLPAPGDFATP